MAFEDTIKMVKYTRRRDDRMVDAIKQFLFLAPNVLFLKDYTDEAEAGKYVLVSREWERTFDLKSDSVVGKSDHDLFPKPIADDLRRDDIHTLQFGRVVTKVNTGGSRYNGWKPTRMALIPLKVLGEDRYTFLAGFALPPFAAWTEAE